jgi:hypothetical protein
MAGDPLMYSYWSKGGRMTLVDGLRIHHPLTDATRARIEWECALWDLCQMLDPAGAESNWWVTEQMIERLDAFERSNQRVETDYHRLLETLVDLKGPRCQSKIHRLLMEMRPWARKRTPRNGESGISRVV